MVNIKEYFDIGDYEINDGLVNTSGDVKLIKKFLFAYKKLPANFGHVGENFSCIKNKLTSLQGAPTTVGGNFDCEDNKLNSLLVGPTTVGGDFLCWNNQLTSLLGAPTSVGNNFDCRGNQLTGLLGAPTSVGRFFICDWKKNLPMLRLLQYKKVRIYENKLINKIIKKYLGQKPLKKAIFDCQYELIKAGFAGNAAW